MVEQTMEPAGLLELGLADWPIFKWDERVTVMIKVPQMPEAFEVVYGCRFPVNVGDAVLCPGTPTHPEPHVGIVTSLTDTTGYNGPIKYLIRKEPSRGTAE